MRKQALGWWHSMTFENQFYKTIDWLANKGKDTTRRHPQSLTGREIQEIYKLNKSLKESK